MARMYLIHEQVQDLLTAIIAIAYPPNVENKKEIHEIQRKEYVAGLHSKLAAIAKFLGNDPWMGGNQLTYVDFFIYDILDFNRRLFLSKHVNEFPTLVAFMNRVENLKGVKEYLHSYAFKPMPIFGPFAMFGSTEAYQPLD